MRLTKCFIVLSLFLLLGTCDSSDDFDFDLNIDIHDYEEQLSAWNTQNMLNYQIVINYRGHGSGWSAVVNVNNGIPESNDPPGKGLTIPVFYSFIKQEEKRVRNEYKKGGSHCFFYAAYNAEYHYPDWIFSEAGSNGEYWEITLTPR
jgi:hypothetical protein